MALIGRVFVVMFAFLVASFAAAFVLLLSILITEWGDVVTMSPYGAWVTVGFFGFLFSGVGLLPAFIVIVIAEAFRLRSVLFYTIVSGLGFAAIYYSITLGSEESAGALPDGRGWEVMAAAGIAAGFVYWAIAGRNAGNWQDRAGPPAVQNAPTPPPPPSV